MGTASQHSNESESTSMFSVIMPIYNHAEYIDEAIRSVLNQSCSDWELIVIDDGSTDDSIDIAETYAKADGRIRVHRQPNAGPAAARNAGVGLAGANWLAFLDSDDVWYPDTLAAYAQAIGRYPQAGFIYGYRDRSNQDGSVTKLTSVWQQAPTATADLFGRMFLSTLACCLRRNLFNEVGGFDEALRSCEDYDLCLRLSLHTEFTPIGKSTGLRRRHGRNISARTGFSRFQEAEVLRRFLQQEGALQAVPEQLVAKRLAKLYCSSGQEYLKSRSFRHGLVALKESRSFRRTTKAFLLTVLCIAVLPFGRKDRQDIPRLV